jgi:hypothetical protein
MDPVTGPIELVVTNLYNEAAAGTHPGAAIVNAYSLSAAGGTSRRYCIMGGTMTTCLDDSEECL